MSSDTNPSLPTLRRRVAQAPTSPGVYRWKDEEGTVLYVGKAKNLRNRLRNYVQEGNKRSAWTEIMMHQARDFDLTLTNSDLEALMLETNLIKELRPKYNIMMKDDKNYVYLRITMQDTYPRLEIVRRMEKDGAMYFGPKTSAENLRKALAFLRTIFPFRTCKMGIVIGKDTIQGANDPVDQKLEDQTIKSETENEERLNEKRTNVALDVTCIDRDRPTPCLDHHIKQCSAPCIGLVSPEQYRKDSIDGVIAFFQGKYEEIEKLLKSQMQEAAASKKFERAAKLRDHLHYLHAMQEKQLVSDTSRANTDIIGTAVLSGHAYVVLLQERDGKMVSEESFSLKGHAESAAEVLSQFIPQYYNDAADLPDTVITGEEPEEREAIEEWLSNLHGKKVTLHVPERGKKSKLLILAEKNADWKARQSEAKWESQQRQSEGAVAELQRLLQLPTLPERIEGYDISHQGGTETVGSMVVFVGGKPKREHYRSFNIKSVKSGKIDDYKSLQEVLTRRLRYVSADRKKEEEKWKSQGIQFGKGRKDEQETIRSLIIESQQPVADGELPCKEFLLARKDDAILAFACLAKLDGVLELKYLWAQGSPESQELLRFVLRKLLQSLKKAKVYAVIEQSQESMYGEMGFRYVVKPPSAIEALYDSLLQGSQEDPDRKIVVVYDTKDNKIDESFTSTPDLILIDGGKGQLSSVLEVARKMNVTIPIASLAKREEEIYVPDNPIPVDIPKESPAQFMLQRLRDEAHRFANYKREGRGKRTLFTSALDEVPGVGESTRIELMKTFGSVEGVRAATDEELLKVVTQVQLEGIREGL